MTTLPIGRYRFFQKIQPLFLLSKMASNHNTGCWQVYSPSASWLIYMEKGELVYISYSEQMFDILHRNLQRLSEQVPNLRNAIDKHFQSLLETHNNDESIESPEYRLICWLVNQNHITSAEAGMLIEQLALDVLEPLLKIEDGSYEFVPEVCLDDLPRFCHLDLRVLFEECQDRQQQRNAKPASAQQQCIQFIKAKARKYQAKIEQKFIRQERHEVINDSSQFLIPSISDPEIETNNTRQETFQTSTEQRLYKVVCIDDSPVVVNAVKNFLDQQIFTVTGISDPLKALMQIIRIKPDIILLDIEMPNLDGYEICSLLRKHSYFQNTPVIMVTGRTGFIDKAKAKMVKSTGYLTKPFSQVDLLKIIFQNIK
ncbi:two-component system response regulator [Scytonema hofmannii PCC 7110]|uniref:Protein PatA n=2 Tax=Scytonema hofmannii TaxID=34078 RepID=A0A139WW50_9CYAN|nr:response regulator [Scytonema hofmannii]KYC36671.1 two-component system response regulator [Scytonema hofmannii PCC 7110]